MHLPSALHIDVVVAVHQNIPHRGIAKQGLQGAVTHQLVPDFLAQPFLLGPRQGLALFSQDDVDAPAQVILEDVVRGVGQAGEVQQVDEPEMDLGLQFIEGVFFPLFFFLLFLAGHKSDRALDEPFFRRLLPDPGQDAHV